MQASIVALPSPPTTVIHRNQKRNLLVSPIIYDIGPLDLGQML